jgi:hypothetical protein
MKFLFALCVLGACAVHCSAIDREAFTFTKYELDVRIEPEQQRLAVRGRVTLRNDSASPQRNVSLQISSTLHWRSIHAGDKDVQYVTQPYTSDIDHTGELSEAIVTLPQDVPPKGKFELEIGYEGVIALDATRLTRIGVPKKVAEHSDWDVIGKSFTAVRGIGYVTWYPITTASANLSEGNSVFEAVGRWKAREAQAEMTLQLTDSGVGSPPALFCNGERGQPLEQPTGTPYQVTMKCTFRLLGMTVPLFTGAEYSVLSHDAITIDYEEEHGAAAQNYGLAAELAIPFVTEWFGVPREAISVVELFDAQAAPYESGTLLLTPLASSDSRLYRLTAVHQLTHAAFPSPRPWVYEGLAHFAQALDREQQSGRQAALDFMAPHRESIADVETGLAANHQGDTHEALIDTGNEEFYRSKAMFVWWMLRDMIGEQPLKKTLAAYRPEQDQDPAYLQRLLEARSGRDLQWFFDGWVYHDRGLPQLRVESAYPRATTSNGYMVTVTVDNLGDVGAEVPVTVKMVQGEITRRVEVHAKAKVSVRVDCLSTPIEVELNDGSVPEGERSKHTFKVEIPATAPK